MKKLFTLLVVVFFALLGCQQPPAEKEPSAAEVKEVISKEIAAPVRSAAFGISVNSIANGATVSEVPVVISGSVSTIANSMSVNNYQLQGYEKGSGTWSYTASPELGNLTVGENIYEIKAEGPDGISVTTTLTINFEPAE